MLLTLEPGNVRVALQKAAAPLTVRRMRDPALTRAIELTGSVTALAVCIGVTRPAVAQWRRVPATRVLAVEKATGGQVSRHELRPDLYPVERAA